MTIQRFSDLVIAVVGGDEREQEIARLATLTGARVRAFGFPWPEGGVEGVTLAASAAEALAGAHVALFPIPGMTLDGAIFATTPIIPDRALLAHMASGARIILGRADAGLRDAAAAHSIALIEYEHDQEMMMRRMPAIVEGAVQQIIANTPFTIHGARAGVIGLGNIGAMLTRTLIALGARVTVAARNPVQRATAFTFGAADIAIDDLALHAANIDILCSTVPAPIVTAEIIDRMPPRALIVDLSAPPGGCDLAHARATGRGGIWARALGRRAPITVGTSQWVGIEKLIRAGGVT